MGRPARALAGQRFGFLTVIRRAPAITKTNNAAWLCRCDCGTEKVIVGMKLLRGEIRSCGCQRGHLLSEALKGRFAMDRNPNWKGGRSLTSHGYVIVKVGPTHPLAHATGYAYEHRLVASRARGTMLNADEVTHHRNERKADNVPANLEVLNSHAEHAVRHRVRTDLKTPGDPNPIIACACGCGAHFNKYDQWNRPRRYVAGHMLARDVRPRRYRRVDVRERSGTKVSANPDDDERSRGHRRRTRSPK